MADRPAGLDDRVLSDDPVTGRQRGGRETGDRSVLVKNWMAVRRLVKLSVLGVCALACVAMAAPVIISVAAVARTRRVGMDIVLL